MSETRQSVTAQLRKLGVANVQDFQKYIDYCHDTHWHSGYGMTWSKSVLQARKFDDDAVLLIEEHHWVNSSGGIEMSTFVVVISAGKLYISKKDVFRHRTDPESDNPRRRFDEITSLRYYEKNTTFGYAEKFIVDVRSNRSKTEARIVLSPNDSQ